MGCFSAELTKVVKMLAIAGEETICDTKMYAITEGDIALNRNKITNV
jgi:hypothetical protein